VDAVATKPAVCEKHKTLRAGLNLNQKKTRRREIKKVPGEGKTARGGGVGERG